MRILAGLAGGDRLAISRARPCDAPAKPAGLADIQGEDAAAGGPAGGRNMRKEIFASALLLALLAGAGLVPQGCASSSEEPEPAIHKSGEADSGERDPRKRRTPGSH